VIHFNFGRLLTHYFLWRFVFIPICLLLTIFSEYLRFCIFIHGTCLYIPLDLFFLLLLNHFHLSHRPVFHTLPFPVPFESPRVCKFYIHFFSILRLFCFFLGFSKYSVFLPICYFFCTIPSILHMIL